MTAFLISLPLDLEDLRAAHMPPAVGLIHRVSDRGHTILLGYERLFVFIQM